MLLLEQCQSSPLLLSLGGQELLLADQSIPVGTHLAHLSLLTVVLAQSLRDDSIDARAEGGEDLGDDGALTDGRPLANLPGHRAALLLRDILATLAWHSLARLTRNSLALLVLDCLALLGRNTLALLSWNSLAVDSGHCLTLLSWNSLTLLSWHCLALLPGHVNTLCSWHVTTPLR